MKRWLPLLLAVSVGLNLGLLWGRWRAARPPAAPPDLAGPPAPPGEFLPGRPAWRCWMREIAPALQERRRRVAAARLALRDALARPRVEEAEVRRCLDRLGAAQRSLDSLVAFSLAHRLETLPPDERRRVLQSLPWSRSAGGPRHRRPPVPCPAPSP